MPETGSRSFEAFVASDGVRLHRVLCAHFGSEHGAELSADALAYAWENWGRVAAMQNPTGYLYRVAQSSLRRHVRLSRQRSANRLLSSETPDPEPELHRALRALPASQRTAVILVHGLGWTLDDAAGAMAVSVSTLRNHLQRGLARLRSTLGVDDV